MEKIANSHDISCLIWNFIMHTCLYYLWIDTHICIYVALCVYIYIYSHMRICAKVYIQLSLECVCVCVCLYVCLWREKNERTL